MHCVQFDAKPPLALVCGHTVSTEGEPQQSKAAALFKNPTTGLLAFQWESGHSQVYPYRICNLGQDSRPLSLSPVSIC